MPSQDLNETVCSICEKNVESGGVECAICKNWSHCKCVGIPKTQQPLVPKKQIYWCCIKCNEAASTIFDLIGKLQTAQEEFRDHLKSCVTISKEDVQKLVNDSLNSLKAVNKDELHATLHTKIDNLKTELKTELSSDMKVMVETEVTNKTTTYADIATKNVQDLEKLTKKVDTQIAKPLVMNEEVTDLISKVSKEEAIERERIKSRQCNLIIHNLHEGNNIDEDIETTKTIIKDILKLTDIDILNATRLGKPGEDRDRPRLLRITLHELAHKKKILSRASQLRDLTEEDPYYKVYMRPDLTPNQLKESKNLYGKLIALRQQHPDRSYKIHRGEIVPVQTE